MAFWKKKKPADEADTAPVDCQAPAPPGQQEPAQRLAGAPPAPQAAQPLAQPPSAHGSAPQNPPQASAPSPQSPGAPAPASAAATAPAAAAPSPVPAGIQFPSVTSPIAASLGKVVSVLMVSKRFQGMSLRELSKIILPAVFANQFLVAEVRAQGADVTMPVGVLLWAQISNELDQKLIAENGSKTLLSGNEWKSGNNLWIIETVGQPKIVKALIRQLVEGPFKGRYFKFCTKAADGTFSIEEFDPAAVSEQAP